MKSAGNRGVVHDRLQVLHVHVFLAAPLGARHMAEPGADQHEGEVAVREGLHHAGTSADLPVQPFNHVVRADPGPVLMRTAFPQRCPLPSWRPLSVSFPSAGLPRLWPFHGQLSCSTGRGSL